MIVQNKIYFVQILLSKTELLWKYIEISEAVKGTSAAEAFDKGKILCISLV